MLSAKKKKQKKKQLVYVSIYMILCGGFLHNIVLNCCY